MADLDPLTIPGFSTAGFDRCDEVRVDPLKLAEFFADPAARKLLLNRLDPLIDGDALVRAPLSRDAKLEDHVLLGKSEDGVPLFAELARNIPHGGTFAPRVWEAASLLSPEELSLYGAARSLIDWHARHGFCAQCGSSTTVVKGGWSRKCNGCGAEHFPRVDPVVIMLAEYQGRVLVGRQHRFPPGRYSALAGFIEPGETVEGAVERELFEEAGIRVTDVRYVMSQPWPFPSSLMIACVATAESDILRLDEQEIEDAFWVDADEARAAMNGDEGAPFIAPPPIAVAHHLLRYWLDRA